MRVTHELRFTKPTPGAQNSQGYALRWQGAALMGILNVTPDSFSDGGDFMSLEAALSQAKGMLTAGALILDIGGESTRPGAEPVSAEDELDRVLPIIKTLREETDALISVDTYKPEVAQAALRAGANLINDVSGLRDAAMVEVGAKEGVPVIIMHMQGTPQSMQREPLYEDVSREVFSFLTETADRALSAGVPSVILDPGIGFGKTLEHNLSLVRNLANLTACPYPVLLGASRKGTIGKLTGVADAAERDPGSVAFHLFAAQRGAAILRVHNVATHAQALSVWHALTPTAQPLDQRG